MWKPATFFICGLLIVDSFFVAYAVALNSRHVVVVEGTTAPAMPTATSVSPAVTTTTTTTSTTTAAPATATAPAITATTATVPAVAPVPPNPQATSKLFSDLSSATDPRLINALDRAAEAGVLEQNVDKKFHPNDPVSRADFTRWLLRMRQIQPASPVAATYSDVSTDSPYYKDIEGATAANLVHGFAVKGKSQKVFRPEEPITREDFATMYGIFSGNATKAANLSNEEEKEDLRFDPNKSSSGSVTYMDEGTIGDESRKYVAFAQRSGILEQAFDVNPNDQSEEKRYLHPQQKLTRAEAVNIIVKLYGLHPTK